MTRNYIPTYIQFSDKEVLTGFLGCVPRSGEIIEYDGDLYQVMNVLHRQSYHPTISVEAVTGA